MFYYFKAIVNSRSVVHLAAVDKYADLAELAGNFELLETALSCDEILQSRRESKRPFTEQFYARVPGGRFILPQDLVRRANKTLVGSKLSTSLNTCT